MAFHKVRALAVVGVLAAPLFLAACGGSNDAGPTESPSSSSSSSSSSASASPSVSVDSEIKDAINPEEGQAVIPGSIESVEQSLSAECTAAVAPLRAAMEKYPSGLSMPQAEKEQLFNVDLAEARATCGDTTQEWTDFYALEFTGWFFAKVD